MKQISTWLWCAFTIVNVGLGKLVAILCSLMMESFQDLLGDEALPSLTLWVINVRWWPYCFACVGLVGLTVSLVTRLNEKTSLVVMNILLLGEIVALACTAIGLYLPIHIPITRM